MSSEIRDTWELRRVLALPRRDLFAPGYAEACAAELTPLLRLAGSSATLRPWQGVALRELYDTGGLFAGLPVGEGKTLISLLAPIVVDAKRPVLIVPGSLRRKTFVDFQRYAQDWQMPNPVPQVLSYEELTLEENVALLSRMAPDLVVLDEAHVTRRRHESSVAKRLARYVGETEPRVVYMSGTPGRMSLVTYAHGLVWALKEGAPVPLDEDEMFAWAALIDLKTPGARGALKRPRVGAFVAFGATESIESARTAFRSRLLETPGVVVVDKDSCDQPLTIEAFPAPEDPVIDAALTALRHEWVLPDGFEAEGPLDMARYEAQLSCGLFLKWHPRPPDWWLGPRSECAAFVRSEIQRTARMRTPLDTEKAVFRAHADHRIVKAWRVVKKKFTPTVVPVWLSSSVVQAAADWAEREGPGLVWTHIVAFGEALSAATKLDYFGPGGETAGGKYVEHADPSRSAILSFAANMLGRNLQAWNRALFVNMGKSALYLEQSVGRIHRAGQTRAVYIDAMMTSAASYSAMSAAIAEARHNAQTTSLRQKVLRARITRALPEMSSTNRARWFALSEKEMKS